MITPAFTHHTIVRVTFLLLISELLSWNGILYFWLSNFLPLKCSSLSLIRVFSNFSLPVSFVLVPWAPDLLRERWSPQSNVQCFHPSVTSTGGEVFWKRLGKDDTYGRIHLSSANYFVFVKQLWENCGGVNKREKKNKWYIKGLRRNHLNTVSSLLLCKKRTWGTINHLRNRKQHKHKW